jgi:CheY-like chemotaxis protein
MAQSGLSFPRPIDAPRWAPGKVPPPPSRRVLIVEDDSAIRGALTDALQDEGFDVATAANGRQALERLRGGPLPAAIVLDLMMPVMDGWDFRNAQLQDPRLRQIPVVVVTAAGFSVDTVRTQFGDVALVPKPVEFFDLVSALERACDRTPPTA